MPNNIDMGGFGSPGIPVLAAVDGKVLIDGRANGSGLNPAYTKAFGVSVRGVNKLAVYSDGSIGGKESIYAARMSLGVGSNDGFIGFGRADNSTIFPVGIDSSNSATGIRLSANFTLGWTSSTTTAIQAADVTLCRDAANELAQRISTNAQKFRVYGTFTDSSNYVRASLAATSTAVTLAAETAGTGADDVPVVLTPAGTSQVEVGNGVQFTEMTAPSAPAANKVILFAQDNGAGKTQLMALFASGAAQQVAIEP